MAAKPPKPPGKLLSERNNNNNSNNSNNTNALVNVGDSERSNNNNVTNYVNNYQNRNNNNVLLNSSDNGTNQTPISTDPLVCGVETPPTQTTAAEQPPPPPTPTCNCTNISIMHLFHEMKQEFPTIPDTIVAQCVSENCHQRDHCIEVLRNELILNPMPAQTYPAKQLIQQQLRQQQQQQRNAPATPPSTGKPVKPLKPTRVAPSPLHAVKPTLTAKVCDNVTSKNLQKPPPKDVNCDMSASTHRQQQQQQQQQQQHQQHPQPQQQYEPAVAPTAVRPNRPTTLDLVRSKDQKEQRKQLNIELQRHLQQRQHRQQTPTPTAGSASPSLNRPSRRAPLPPLPPKPHSPHTTAAYHAATANGHASGSSATTSPISPISSCGGESEISVNVSLSSPTSNVAAAAAASSKNLPLKTPVRHRSVITLQPEPPYAKQLAAANSPVASGQKSFTSLNLTLRQPNPAAPPSTIDISAGPSPSGAGTGLTYSSTTYDSRSGCQKNFHITVTDQVGAFSASRISPHSLAHQNSGDQPSAQVQQYQYVSRPISQQELLQQQRLERAEQQNATAARYEHFDEMCYTEEYDAHAATLQRQKDKRDKLASALRDNKKRLSQMKNEIVVLTQPITPGLPERLDSEINKLLEDCHAMSQRTDSGGHSGPSEMNEPHSQTFPGQRSPATAHTPYSNGSGGGYASTTSASSSATTPTNNSTQHVHFPPHTDDESDVQGEVDDEPDDGDDGDEEEERWSCSMCTFQNHPLLNICEQCDNVRILPGTVRIVAGQAAASGGQDASAGAAGDLQTPTNVRVAHGMPTSPGLHSMVAATTASIGAIAAPSAMLTTEQS